MKLSTLALMAASSALLHASAGSAQSLVGVFDMASDVGNPKLAGSTIYDADKREYVMTGAGENMWFRRDEHQFAWKRLKDNFVVQAEGKFLTAGGREHRKFGWIARASLDPASAQVNVVIHADGRTSLQWRPKTGDNTTEDYEKIITMEGADFCQLQRRGSTYIGSAAKFGEPLKSVEVGDIDLGAEPYVGLFVCSHDKDAIQKVRYRNVRVTQPAKDNFVPYRDYIGSRLELLDVDTGEREVIYEAPGQLEAPNWTPDGKALIYNGKGLLYRFDLATRTPTQIDTGFGIRNNNDKVLSFDGKMLGISHHVSTEGGKSIIFTLPATGGEPKRVTPEGPSYLHGWSPDGKFLVYTGQRNGELDIYKIPVSGGEEIQLTDSKGVDDGPEYSPDGNYIYFNSSRSGRMQLWRMKPDGSEQTQLTDDEFNNWFPHISPDGKRIVFLSYMPEVEAGDHPYYKPVLLRMMPVHSGKPKVIAYLYGGQGTINVPSWSPDSKKVAFVSNSATE